MNAFIHDQKSTGQKRHMNSSSVVATPHQRRQYILFKMEIYLAYQTSQQKTLIEHIIYMVPLLLTYEEN
jgi:hypothetical protein